MHRSTVFLLLAALFSASGVPAAPQEPLPDVATLEAIATQPERFDDRQVRLKIFKALDAPSPELVAAAVEIVMRSPDLAADPMLWRRFNAALSSSDAARRKAVLDRAAKKGAVTDVRVIAVVVEALTDADAPLRAVALSLVTSQPALRQNPAVAEALGRSGEAVTGVVLPAFDAFKTRVQPVLEEIGPDKKTCPECHENHSVLRLPPMDGTAAAEPQLEARYRAALRVVDLQAPERSLILRKPTSPKVEAPLTHGGDVRFEPDSASYRAILEWIKTGGMAR